MMLFLILMFVFGFVALVSLGAIIFGIIKKRKNIIISSSVIFTITLIGGVYSTFTYTKKAFNYVRSDQFQHDTRKGSELIGKTIGSASSGVSGGISNTLDEASIDSLASKSATIFGKVTKTVASNFDSTIGATNIYLDKTIENTGIELGRADEKYNANRNDLSVFIDYKKDFKGKLRITNYDQNGRKIELAEKSIIAQAGQGKVEIFSFLHSGLGITTYFIMSRPE